MYLRNDIDISQFLSSVIKCEEAVFFYTKNGDSFNLNSILSSYVFRAHIAEDDDWRDGTIRCLKEKDYALLKEYLTETPPSK